MPTGAAMHMAGMGADIELPLERPLFTPAAKPRLAEVALEAGEDAIDTSRLFDQVRIDKSRLRANIQQSLRQQAQVTLREVLDAQPLQQGLAELIAYLELAHAPSASAGGIDSVRALVDESVDEPIRWLAHDPEGEPTERCARLPRVIFAR
jgi:hypothetical protein